MNPQRGEICPAALDPTVGSEIAKRRPCLILTTDLVNVYRRTVVVVPLSSSPTPHPPITVPIQCQGRPAVAVVDQIRAVSKQRLWSLIGCASAVELEAVGEALKQILEVA